MKSAIALLLALLLCLGVLSGCDKNPSKIPAETTAAPTETTAAPTETTVPITEPQPEETEPAAYSFAGKSLDVYAGHASAMDGTDLNRFIEETLGLDILWLTPAEGGLTCAPPVYPSLKFTTEALDDFNGISTYGSYGAYVNYWDYQELMPNFFARFNDESDPVMVAYKQSYMSSEDELYALPIFTGGDVGRYGWMYRQDIFEALRLEVPTDWDSFLGVLRTLKAAYPESYPFAMRSKAISGLYAMGEFAQQFGVNYASGAARDPYTENYYDPGVTDEYRNMLRCIRQLIEEELMDPACLNYDTAQWQQAFAAGVSFITYDKTIQLSNLELVGQRQNSEYAVDWFNNFPFFADRDNAVPYQCRDDAVKGYAWITSTKCTDLELALRYLDWLYSEEGSRIMSWGIEGESYGVDAEGNKFYLEGFDITYMARYQESGLVDLSAVLEKYTPKCQEMILGTMAAAAEGGWEKCRTILTWSVEEQILMDTYHQSWVDAKADYLMKFLTGELDVNQDADWNAYLESLLPYRVENILAAYDAAYARLQESRNAA